MFGSVFGGVGPGAGGTGAGAGRPVAVDGTVLGTGPRAARGGLAQPAVATRTAAVTALMRRMVFSDSGPRAWRPVHGGSDPWLTSGSLARFRGSPRRAATPLSA